MQIHIHDIGKALFGFLFFCIAITSWSQNKVDPPKKKICMIDSGAYDLNIVEEKAKEINEGYYYEVFKEVINAFDLQGSRFFISKVDSLNGFSAASSFSIKYINDSINENHRTVYINPTFYNTQKLYLRSFDRKMITFILAHEIWHLVMGSTDYNLKENRTQNFYHELTCDHMAGYALGLIYPNSINFFDIKNIFSFIRESSESSTHPENKFRIAATYSGFLNSIIRSNENTTYKNSFNGGFNIKDTRYNVGKRSSNVVEDTILSAKKLNITKTNKFNSEINSSKNNYRLFLPDHEVILIKTDSTFETIATIKDKTFEFNGIHIFSSQQNGICNKIELNIFNFLDPYKSTGFIGHKDQTYYYGDITNNLPNGQGFFFDGKRSFTGKFKNGSLIGKYSK